MNVFFISQSRKNSGKFGLKMLRHLGPAFCLLKECANFNSVQISSEWIESMNQIYVFVSPVHLSWDASNIDPQESGRISVRHTRNLILALSRNFFDKCASCKHWTTLGHSILEIFLHVFVGETSFLLILYFSSFVLNDLWRNRFHFRNTKSCNTQA